MLARFADFDRTFGVLDELRRQMDRVWEDYEGIPAKQAPAAWPRFNVFDGGAELILEADVPGLTEKDLDVSLEDGVLSIRGELKQTAKEGYTLLRRERPALKFARSIALPFKVDAERTTALVKDGVLTVTLAKAPEARPRQIAVRAQG